MPISSTILSLNTSAGVFHPRHLRGVLFSRSQITFMRWTGRRSNGRCGALSKLSARAPRTRRCRPNPRRPRQARTANSAMCASRRIGAQRMPKRWRRPCGAKAFRRSWAVSPAMERRIPRAWWSHLPLPLPPPPRPGSDRYDRPGTETPGWPDSRQSSQIACTKSQSRSRRIRLGVCAATGSASTRPKTVLPVGSTENA